MFAVTLSILFALSVATLLVAVDKARSNASPRPATTKVHVKRVWRRP